ncbi:MAG: hypothetical protein RLZ75_187 [Pseudomonadota bacterium]
MISKALCITHIDDTPKYLSDHEGEDESLNLSKQSFFDKVDKSSRIIIKNCNLK